MVNRRYRVVLDTSVVAAASRSRRGASALLIGWLAERRFDVVISAKLILEYEDVLARDPLPGTWTPQTIGAFLDFMCDVGQPIDPFVLLRPSLPDPGDEFVLELAFAATVDFIVTHNVRDFAAGQVYGVNAVTPGEFVRLLRGPS
jgi:putative PIN family toxin of toxin-antitoxin system